MSIDLTSPRRRTERPPPAARAELAKLPAGQLVAIMMAYTGGRGSLIQMVREIIPQGTATPRLEDYAAIAERGLVVMRGGMHLTPAGTCVAEAVVRAMRGGTP